MRLLRKTIVVGFAGLGLYKAWELLSPMLSSAKDKTLSVRDQVEPAVRQAADTVQGASHDAAGSLVDASRQAAGTVTDAVVDATKGDATKGSETANGAAPADESSSAGASFGV